MKYLYILLFLTGISASGINQEMITHYQSEGSFDVCYAKSIDSVNYLITIDLNDKLNVYKIKSKDSLQFMHSKHFENLYSNKIVKFKDSLMLFDIPGYLVVYDFVKNETIKEKIPEDFFIHYWKFESDTSVYFGMRNNFSYNSNSKYFKYSFKTGISECDTLVFRALHKKDNYYIFETFSGDNHLETYYLYDENTGTKDTLISDLTFWKFMRMYMGDSCVWYQDTTGALCSFNYTTKEKKRYEDISSEPDEINMVKKVGNNLIITNSGKKGFYLQIFDLNTKKRTHHIQSDYSYSIYHYKIIEDKLLTTHYEEEFVVIDINTGNYKSFDSYNAYLQFSNLSVIENRYIINIVLGGFHLIDLKNMTSIKMKGTENVYFRNKCDYIKLSDNDYVASIANHEDNIGFTPLYHIDLHSKSYEGLSELLGTNRGLDIGSRLVSVQGQIILANNDLYHINGTSVEKINSKPLLGDIYGRNYALFDYDLYYFTAINGSDSIRLMKFDGTNRSLIATFPFDQDIRMFDQIVIIDKVLYFVINFGEFYRFSLDKHELKKLSSHVFDFGKKLENKNFLFHFGKNIYYCDNLDWELYAIYDNGDPQYVTGNLVRTTPVIIIKDKIFVMLKTGIYEMKNNSLLPLINYSASSCSLSMEVIEDKEHQYMLIPAFSDLNSAYFYDGNKLKKIIPGQKIISFGEFGNDIYKFGKNYLFDCNKAKVVYGVDIPENEHLFDALIFENDTFIVTYINKGYSEKINFYHSTDFFKNNEFIDAFLNIRDLRNINFLNIGESGLYYVANKIFYIDEKKDIHLIANILGNKYYTGMIANNNYIYFIAIDKAEGRQVFRIKMPKKISTVDEEVKDNIVIDIYPNPSENYIRIGDNFIGKDYEIYDINGSKVRYGNILNKNIDVSSLVAGVYFIEIKNGNIRYKGKFVKI